MQAMLDTARRSLRFGLLLSLTLLCVHVGPPTTAAAQGSDQPPLAMTFVDGTPRQSGAIHDKLLEIISGSSDIDFVKPRRYLASARRDGVTLAVLNHAGKRVSQREHIRKSMRAQNLESIVVYKRRESTIHLIVIGPRGNELRHFRSPIRSDRINDEQALGVLRKLFEVLVPEVRDFRRRNPNANTGPAASTGAGGQSGATDRGSDDPIKNKAIEEHKDAHANLQQGVTLSLSPIFGRRSLNIQTEGGFKLGHVTPFFGGEFRADAVFGLLDADTAAIGGTLFVDYAPFSTSFPGDPKKYRASFFRGGLSLRYMAGLTETLILFGEVGGEGLNIGIQSNRTYVGSTYGAINAGLGIINRFEGLADLRIYAGAMPTILTNTNDGAFGSGGFSFGFNADARFTLRLLDPFHFAAFYDFQLLNPHHPNPRDHDTVANGADIIHMGGLSVAYHF